MNEVLFDIKELLTDIKTLLESIANNNVDILQGLSRIAGKGIYNLDDIGKIIDAVNDKIAL